MRRVASRPRLFSWDQFDATATDHPDYDGIFDNDDDKHQEEDSSITTANGGGHNDNDHDSDYMSCLSQSLHSTHRRYSSNGNYTSYGGQCSRSSSMLSLKNFSAHAYLEDDDEEEEKCSSGKGEDTVIDGMNGNAFMLLLDTDSEDVPSCVVSSRRNNIIVDSDAHDWERRKTTIGSLPPSSPQEEYRAANVVSPPGTPRRGTTVDIHPSTMLLEVGSTGPSNKKRNLDALEKSVLFPRLVDSELLIVSNASESKHDDDDITATVAPFNLLDALHQDVLIDCLEYLSLDDLKSLSVTCCNFYHLLSFGTMYKQRNRTKTKESTNHETVSGIRNVLWWNWMRRQWPDVALVPTLDSANYHSDGILSKPVCNVKFVDRKSKSHDAGGRMNYIALFSQSQSSPTCIASKYFEERLTPPNLISFPAEQRRPPLFRSFYKSNNNKTVKENQDGLQIVQFIGDVGIGDRSICSNRPFPRPLNDCKKWNRRGVQQNQDYHHHNHTRTAAFGSFPPSSPIARLHGLPQHIHNLIQEQRELASNSHKNRLNIFERLRGCNMYNHSVGAVIQGKQQDSHRKLAEETAIQKGPQPFVSPYISSMKLCVEIDLTPRMMAYFEVSILRKDDVNLNGDKDETGTAWSSFRMQPPRPRMVRAEDQNIPQNQNEVHSACVAVGLSTQGFYDSSRMPGWDSSSYGYHGDDGGIFHSHGEMIRVYGPTYNVGDTVDVELII
jgi:hypothetical protein